MAGAVQGEWSRSAQVRAIALRVGEAMGAAPEVEEVNFDWMEPSRQVRIHIDQDQARLLGLSSQVISQTLNTLMTGGPITQVRDDIYLVNVIARAQDEQRSSLSTLRALQLPLPNGRTVPLSQLATFDFKQEYPLIWRRQRVPTLTVQAEVAPGSSPASAVQALAPAIEKLSKSLPKGYHIEVGGTVEESAKSQASVFAMVPLMLLLMVFFLMAQLHSFSRLFLVVSVIPMGLIGIVFTLLIFGRPLGLCGDPRYSGAVRHDCPQCRSAHRADRDRANAETAHMGRGDRSDTFAFPPHHVDGDFHGPRIYSDRPGRILGTDGFCDHGRAVRGDDSHAGGFAHALHHIVPGQGTHSGKRCGLIHRIRTVTSFS